MRLTSFPPAPFGSVPPQLWTRLTLGCFMLQSLPRMGPMGWVSSGKGIMNLFLHCWLRATFLGPGWESGVSQSTELSGICSGPLGWEGQNTRGQLCRFPLSPGSWGDRRKGLLSHGSFWPVFSLPLLHSSFPLHASPLPTLSLQSPLPNYCPLGLLSDFQLYFPTSLFPLLSRPGPALALCVSQPLCFWLFSLSSLPTEQTEGGEVITSHVPGGKRGDFHTFLSLSELDCCHCKMGRQAVAPGCTSEAGPGSWQDSSHIPCPRRVLEVAVVLAPGRDVGGLARARGSRPRVLCRTALSSPMSPSEHTASSLTSKVKCGCFNHWRESLILLLQHIAASPAPGTAGSRLLPVLNWFQKR